MSLQRLQRNAAPLAYLKEQLVDGTTLAQVTLKRTDLAAGAFFVEVGTSAQNESELNYYEESLARSGTEKLALSRLIRRFIDRSGCGVLIQDKEASIAPEWLKHRRYAKCLTYYEHEVYWLLKGSDLSETDILTLIRTPMPWPSSMFLYADVEFIQPSRISQRELEHIVGNLQGVAVGAFDETSFLLWWRTSHTRV